MKEITIKKENFKLLTLHEKHKMKLSRTQSVTDCLGNYITLWCSDCSEPIFTFTDAVKFLALKKKGGKNE